MITNPVTGEVVDVSSLGDDELWECREQWKKLRDMVFQGLSVIEAEAVRRLEKRNASKYVSDAWEITMTRPVKRSFDIPTLVRLKDHLDERTFKEVMRPTFEPSWAGLKRLLALGGEIQAIIKSGVIEQLEKPTFQVKRKATPDVSGNTGGGEVEEVPF